jgi:zinc/manganese transport system permease protein
MENLSNILSLLAPAFVAGVIISFVHVPLGQEVLKRGIIFLDLAVAQFAALGMIAFQVFANVDEYSLWAGYGRLGAGLIAAIFCAVVFHFLEKKSGQYQEALIGCAFVLAASLGLIIVANSPHGAEEIKNILEGQILWTSWSHIIFVLPIFIAVFFAWVIFKSKRSFLFYPLFAITIPFSVSMIGVYLVFASLIFPALAIKKLQHHKFIFGLLVSVFAYLLGLMASYFFDWPAGPAIVFMFSVVSLIIFIISNRKKSKEKIGGGTEVDTVFLNPKY